MLKIQWFGLAAATALTVSADVVELAPAPRVEWNAAKTSPAPRELGPAAAGGWLDTSNRAAVAAAWATGIAANENVAMGWTGAVTSCTPGDVSAAWRSAVQTRVNWFRGMAGVPDGIAFDSVWNGKNQQAALMMSANQALSHTPPTNWACYTANGAEAAGKSNICYLSGFGAVDPGCVAGYMRDDGSNNQVAGHRRWLLFPQATRMGTGDVSQTGSFGRANAMWVIDSAALAAPRPATRDAFVAWPPKGYVPYQAVYARWSVAYAGANFAGAAVSMSRNGSPVTSTLLPYQTGYGENTLVWEPSANLGVAGADTPVDVTVSNVIINGQAQTLQYRVIVFDPATAPGGGGTIQVTVNSSPAGRAVTVDGASFQAPISFQWTPGSTHTLSAPSPQAISAGERRVFAGWNFGAANSQTVSPAAATTYTVSFNAEYKLTTRAVPADAGVIGATPQSGDGFYASGQRVALTASAFPPYLFSNWTEDTSGASPQIEVTMNRAIAATAVYVSGGTSPSSGLHFVPVVPCRVADTRNSGGGFGGPILTGGVKRSFLIPQSNCGVPSTARAFSLNLTVVPSGGLGYLSVWPTGQSQPFVSTLNSLDGQVTANAAIVPAGAGGGVDLYATNDSHAIIDINGYFDLPRVGASGFFPLTPCRIADTRNPQGALGGPVLAGGATRSIPVRQSACGIPTAATAYVLNVTVVPVATLGYITAWPTGQSQPFVSTTNSLNGQITANMAIVAAGSDGAISFYAANATHLVIDVTGYFGPPEQAGSLKLYPVNPCRLVDTRNPAGPLAGPILATGGQRSFPVTQAGCGLPTSAKAYSANFTVVPQGSLGYLTTWPSGLAQPFVSTLNALDGQVTANAAIVPAGTGAAISVFVTSSSHVVIDTNGYFAP